MHFHDSFNILTKLSPAKAWNATKVLSSYYRSKHLGHFVNPALPLSMAFEPTTSCNLRCPECPSGLRSFTRPTGMLDVNFFKEKIEEVQSHLAYLTFYFQGEPYLHPGFLDMVTYAVKHDIYTATSTNAHYLDLEKAEATVRSGLDRLIISIDGTSQDTYQQYRVGGQLEKVLEGTRNMVHWKKKRKSKTPHLIFQFLVVAPNEHQIEDARRLAKEVGVDEIQFKTAQIYDFVNGSDLMPKNEKYSRYVQRENGKYKLKNPMHNQCWKMWQSCVVTWDGRVVPCCFDKDAKYVMGNWNEQSFSDIWYSAPYENFRKSILTSRASIDICKNCSEGLNVSLTDG
ncbi:SPASM domain-containing protein [Reichenbachiella carrageenanivorans]|uniref:SPASM domain-containing protein n=1 Tax=Reichenbachiella carrageenanivorans TaxID=2979869 RepID=A0ABY6D456_9BACT|nr:radical SAM/SPASM domain-containing protein [Reichenbachiella carrageenanivorans]UXX80937.1 SPASM domain-containing protein [Reichenbachiella carrageenanivorans]